MSFLIVRVVGAVFMLGQYLVDGPLLPPLDFMLRVFGFRMLPTGIQHVWPLLLTYVPPPEEADSVPVMSWISEWLALGNNPILGGLILGLTYWAVVHFYDWIDTLGGRAISPVLKEDKEYKAKVLKHMKRTCSGQSYSPQDGKGLGKMLEIRLKEREGEPLHNSFYALQVGPAIMDEIKRDSIRKIVPLRRIFSVKVEILEDDQHHFLLFSGPRDVVEEAYKNLRRGFDKKTNRT